MAAGGPFWALSAAKGRDSQASDGSGLPQLDIPQQPLPSGVPFEVVAACISSAGLRPGDRRQPRSKKGRAGRDTCPGEPVSRSVVVTFVLRPSTAAKAVVGNGTVAANARSECLAFLDLGRLPGVFPVVRLPGHRFWQQAPDVSTHIGIPLPFGLETGSGWQQTPDLSAHIRLPLPPEGSAMDGRLTYRGKRSDTLEARWLPATRGRSHREFAVIPGGSRGRERGLAPEGTPPSSLTLERQPPCRRLRPRDGRCRPSMSPSPEWARASLPSVSPSRPRKRCHAYT